MNRRLSLVSLAALVALALPAAAVAQAAFPNKMADRVFDNLQSFFAEGQLVSAATPL